MDALPPIRLRLQRVRKETRAWLTPYLCGGVQRTDFRLPMLGGQ